MGRKQFTTEKIIGMLREADVALAQGMKVGEICRKLEVSEQSYLILDKLVLRKALEDNTKPFAASAQRGASQGAVPYSIVQLRELVLLR